MKLYLMRHGETDLNKLGLMQGQCPTSLNDTGREQSEEAAGVIRREGLTFDRIYVSPLPRAIETCEIATGLTRDHFIQDERILEMGYGQYDQKSIKELLPEFLPFFNDPERAAPPDGVESGLEVRERVASFLGDLAEERPEGNILIVSHTIAIHEMVLVMLHREWHEMDKCFPENCEIFEASGFPGEVTIRSLTRGQM